MCYSRADFTFDDINTDFPTSITLLIQICIDKTVKTINATGLVSYPVLIFQIIV